MSLVNKTEIYENKYGNLNISDTLTREDAQDISAQEILWKELFYNKKINFKHNVSDSMREQQNQIINETSHSVISSDIEGLSSTNRGRSHIVQRNSHHIFPSCSLK